VLTMRRTPRIINGDPVQLMLLSQGLITIGLGTFGVLYNLYLAAAGRSLAFIGTFNAVAILALGLSAVPIGMAGRLVSHKTALIIGVPLLAGVQVLLALTAEPFTLLAASIAWGLAQALCTVTVSPLLSEYTARERRAAVFGQLYATWAAATGVGSVIGGVLPGLLATLLHLTSAGSAAAFRDALLATTVLTVLGWPVLLRLPHAGPMETVEARGEAPVGRGWAMRTVPRILLGVMLTMSLYSFACGLVAPFFNVYFAQQLHLSTSLIGLLFAVAALLSAPGSLLGPRLSRRVGSISAVTLTRLAIVPCLLALMVGELLPLLAMLGFLGRFALIYVAGALDSHFTLAAVPVRTRALASGVRTGTYNLCWALGAWGAGQQIEHVGYPTVFLASAILTVVACVLFFLLFAVPAPSPTQALPTAGFSDLRAAKQPRRRWRR
jgi:predicted MFS family arabinose efflux permease